MRTFAFCCALTATALMILGYWMPAALFLAVAYAFAEFRIMDDEARFFCEEMDREMERFSSNCDEDLFRERK